MDPAFLRVDPVAHAVLKGAGLDPEKEHGLLHCRDGGTRVTIFVDPGFLDMLVAANGTDAMPPEMPNAIATAGYPGWPDDWPDLVTADEFDENWRATLSGPARENRATRRAKKNTKKRGHR